MQKQELLPMNLQFFAGEMDTLDSMMDSFDAGTLQTAGDQGTPPPADDTTPPPAADQTPPPADQTQQNQQNQQTPPSPQQKQAYAFGELRKENTDLMNILQSVAKANGIEYSNKKDLVEKLQQQSLELQSKQTNIPVEILQRLNNLENENRQYTEQRAQQALVDGFAKVTEEFGLTQQELIAFATELDNAGYDPVKNANTNLVDMYRTIHFQDIINKATQKAVEDALKRSSEADQHGTLPGQVAGNGNAGSGVKIETMAQLDALISATNL